jgi:hypothetical protein
MSINIAHDKSKHEFILFVFIKWEENDLLPITKRDPIPFKADYNLVGPFSFIHCM